MIWYFPPATTLGSCLPMWILCTITGMFTVLPVSGSVVWGVWQRTHSSTERRAPPCADIGSWHLLQLAVLMTSRTTETFDPFGTKLNTVSANCVPRLNSVKVRLE